MRNGAWVLLVLAHCSQPASGPTLTTFGSGGGTGGTSSGSLSAGGGGSTGTSSGIASSAGSTSSAGSGSTSSAGGGSTSSAGSGSTSSAGGGSTSSAGGGSTGSPLAPPPPDPIYVDALAANWEDWSWNVNDNLKAAPGEGTFGISVTTTNASAGLSFAHIVGGNPTNFSEDDYVAIEFLAKGSGTIYVAADNGSNSQPIALTSTWAAHRVDCFNNNGPSNRIDFIAQGIGQSFSIDHVMLMKSAPAPSGSGVTTFTPSEPTTYHRCKAFTVSDGRETNSVYVPGSYDGSHQTPSPLLVWLHGCQGVAADDLANLASGSQRYIMMAVGGTDTGCWNTSRISSPTQVKVNTSSDVSRVLAALTDIKKRFNIDPKRVVLGGYSSGGDLAYSTAFYDASLFAGLLAVNTSPFRDTVATATESLAAASWKFNVAQLAHYQDTTYPVCPNQAYQQNPVLTDWPGQTCPDAESGGVYEEVGQLVSHGFAVTLLSREGGHYDNPGATEGPNGTTPVPGTYSDIRTYLLPLMAAGWVAP